MANPFLLRGPPGVGDWNGTFVLKGSRLKADITVLMIQEVYNLVAPEGYFRSESRQLTFRYSLDCPHRTQQPFSQIPSLRLLVKWWMKDGRKRGRTGDGKAVQQVGSVQVSKVERLGTVDESR